MTTILPVIHHTDAATTKAEAAIAFDCGADGVFLISHNGRDGELIPLANLIAKKHKAKRIGVNLLSASFPDAYALAQHAGIDMLWVDNAHLDSRHVGAHAAAVSRNLATNPKAPAIYAGVAFKYQPHEPDPPAAAAAAARLGFIPTTSGAGTGSPPDIAKITAMRRASGARLAIASGITPENIADFLPMATDILVATGISNESGRFDPDRLISLIAVARQSPN